MTDLPIIMSAPMVRAILREIERPGMGKTMTRRLARSGAPYASPWRQIKEGDRLWVRETMTRFQTYGAPFPTCHYPADDTGVCAWGDIARDWIGRAAWQWKGKSLPSIHMPRWASRLTLIVTATKIERLQAITEREAYSEGVVRFGYRDYRIVCSGGIEYRATDAIGCFQALWWALHGIGSWDTNPEVVAITFQPLLYNIDRMKAAAA